jgi:hypothetical protein
MGVARSVVGASSTSRGFRRTRLRCDDPDNVPFDSKAIQMYANVYTDGE